MARLFTESFEPQHFLRFSSFNSPAINTASLIDGVACLLLNGSQYVEKDFSTPLSEFYAGLFIRPVNSITQIQIIRWASGTTELGRLVINTVTRVLDAVVNGVTVASSTQALIDNTIFHIQVHLQIADAGVFQVKLNDTQVINFAGDTKPGADATINKIRWGGINGSSEWDDLTVNDTTGAEDNSWPGIIRIARLLPAGPGTYVNNWSRNTGSTNWEAVDEVPPDNDATYIFTSAANLYESFSMSDQSLVNVNYKALITSVVAKKDSGTVQIAVGIRDDQNSTDYFGVNSALDVSYGCIQERRTVDPSTAATWTSVGINSQQALIDSTSG
jgi:hypothetical protein